MKMIEDFFAALTLQSIVLTIIAGLAGFITGYFIRSVIVAKQKKKIYILEEEMLSSHARILELQKELGEVKAKAANSQVAKKAELKVS